MSRRQLNGIWGIIITLYTFTGESKIESLAKSQSGSFIKALSHRDADTAGKLVVDWWNLSKLGPFQSDFWFIYWIEILGKAGKEWAYGPQPKWSKKLLYYQILERKKKSQRWKTKRMGSANNKKKNRRLDY